ncbi:MAG: glycosyltransferase family 39 protein [Candidatus Hydrogenedentota bacterium]
MSQSSLKSNPTVTSRRTVAAIFIPLILLLITATVCRGITRPDVHWIANEGTARWIHPFIPPDPGARLNKDRRVTYVRTFSLDTVPAEVPLTVEVFRDVQVEVNGSHALDSEATSPDELFTQRRIDIAPFLVPGKNTLRITVQNDTGPHLMRASAPAVDLYTLDSTDSKDSWRFTSDFTGAGKVIDAMKPLLPNTSWLSKTTPGLGASAIPYFLVLSLAIFLVLNRAKNNSNSTPLPSPSAARWWIMALFLAMACNNILRIHYYVGMDINAHYSYLQFLLTEHRLPLATDGIFGFRSPLFYLIASPMFALLNLLFVEDTAKQLIRIVPYLMGLGIIEVHYRLFKRLMPENPTYIILGTLLGAFLPVNLYMSNFISDEPAAGITGACVVLFAIILLHQDKPPTSRQAAIAGILLGLALLSKMSTALLVIPCVIVMIVTHRLTDAPSELNRRTMFKNLAVATLACFIVSGWYFLRNWYHLGAPVVAGWDNTTYEWWQYPGYRTAAQYLRFGQALSYPVDSAFVGYWDGLYSTFWLDGWYAPGKYWNLPLLMTSAWFALLPTVLLGLGIVTPLLRMLADPRNPCTPDDRIALFTSTCIILYSLAILYIHLTTPIYSAVKGTYYFAILPCFAYAIMRGVVFVDQAIGQRVRPFFYATLACWIVSTYGAYFIIR